MSAPIVVLQRSDVIALEQRRELADGRALLAVDPGIADALLAAGFAQAQLRRIEVPRELPSLVYSRAMTLAAAIDQALTDERRSLFGAGAWHGWDQTLLYLTLQRAFNQREVGLAIERAFPEPELALLRPGNAALFNWDSMLDAEIVGADAARWSVAGRYAHGRFWNPVLLDRVFDSQGLAAAVAAVAGTAGAAGGFAITHIPTCFYDAATFARAIEARWAASIDLPGAYCDVPVRRGARPLLRPLVPADLDPRCLRYEQRARAVFATMLAPLIPSRRALDDQAEVFARRALLQAVAYTGLVRVLAGHRPDVVVSDHDVGFNGPLFSAAARLGSAITVLPHSSYPSTLLPHAERVTAVARDGVEVPVRTVLGTPVARRDVSFRDVPSAPARGTLRRICLLLNTMQAEGISHVELFALAGFHARLSAQAAAHGIELVVRPKPSTPALAVLAGALRLPAERLAGWIREPLAEAAARADLCIAFGEPTSATSSFLDAGALLVHVSEQDWPADYVITTPLKGTLMPSWRCDEALVRLEPLLADPAAYRAMQSAQQTAYAGRRARATPDLFEPAPPAPAADAAAAVGASAHSDFLQPA